MHLYYFENFEFNKRLRPIKMVFGGDSFFLLEPLGVTSIFV